MILPPLVPINPHVAGLPAGGSQLVTAQRKMAQYAICRLLSVSKEQPPVVISSRTPEGIPHRCPVCGKSSALEPSYPGGDSCCPTCGHLLWWFRDHLSKHGNVRPERVTFSSKFAEDTGTDSLDLVELVMEIEEDFEVTIPDEEVERMKTVADVIRYIDQNRRR